MWSKLHSVMVGIEDESLTYFMSIYARIGKEACGTKDESAAHPRGVFQRPAARIVPDSLSEAGSPTLKVQPLHLYAQRAAPLNAPAHAHVMTVPCP